MVETATWVKKKVTNRFDVRLSKYFNVTKENLLLFRHVNNKGKYARLELRHQRTADVMFDMIRIDPSMHSSLSFF